MAPRILTCSVQVPETPPGPCLSSLAAVRVPAGRGVCALTLSFKQLYSGSLFQRAWFGATGYGFRAGDLPQGLLPSSYCVTTAANQTCTVSVNRGANSDIEGVYNYRYIFTQVHCKIRLQGGRDACPSCPACHSLCQHCRVACYQPPPAASLPCRTKQSLPPRARPATICAMCAAACSPTTSHASRPALCPLPTRSKSRVSRQ